MQSKDMLIPRKPKVIQVFSNEDIGDVLQDMNHRSVLHFLFKGPLTIDEIKIAFEKDDNSKHEKSIYRYLQKLKKAGLIYEAGKRIYSEGGQIRTKTLFSRVAKIIVAPTSANEDSEAAALKRKSLRLAELLLAERFGLNTKASTRCIGKQIETIESTRNKIIMEIFNNTENQELFDIVNEFDLPELYSIFNTISWLILLKEKPEVAQNLMDCY